MSMCSFAACSWVSRNASAELQCGNAALPSWRGQKQQSVPPRAWIGADVECGQVWSAGGELSQQTPLTEVGVVRSGIRTSFVLS